MAKAAEELEKENRRLREALALMVRAMQDVMPILNAGITPVVEEPNPESRPKQMLDPQVDPNPSPAFSQKEEDGTYRVDVSEVMGTSHDGHYTTTEY